MQACREICPHSMYAFCMNLRVNNGYFPVQHQLIVFVNRRIDCLVCGTK